MAGKLNLIKLSVGSESVETLIDWQRNRSRQIKGNRYFHITRMWPKRAEELLDGGSIYWVIQGVVQARQAIVGLDEVIGEDGIRRCAILLDEEVVRTEPTRKRPFQGWRYLKPEDAPEDLGDAIGDGDELPPKLMKKLVELGAW